MNLFLVLVILWRLAWICKVQIAVKKLSFRLKTHCEMQIHGEWHVVGKTGGGKSSENFVVPHKRHFPNSRPLVLCSIDGHAPSRLKINDFYIDWGLRVDEVNFPVLLILGVCRCFYFVK